MKAVLTTLLAVIASLPIAAQVRGHENGGFGLRRQPVVMGAPFTATVTSSRVQKLPDGNTIQQSYTGYLARDSHGRIYERQTIPEDASPRVHQDHCFHHGSGGRLELCAR